MRRIATLLLVLMLLSSASGCGLRDLFKGDLSHPRHDPTKKHNADNPFRDLEEDALYGDL